MQRLIDLEGLAERLCTLWTNVVVLETAAGPKSRRQRVLTVSRRVEAAYSMEVRVEFVLRRSAIIFAPSTFRPLPPKLQTGVEWTRQGVLTVGFGE